MEREDFIKACEIIKNYLENPTKGLATKAKVKKALSLVEQYNRNKRKKVRLQKEKLVGARAIFRLTG